MTICELHENKQNIEISVVVYTENIIIAKTGLPNVPPEGCCLLELHCCVAPSKTGRGEHERKRQSTSQ